MGASGSGKSTLLNIIAGYDFFDKGEYLLKGRDITDYNLNKVHKEEIGMIFQDYQLLDYLNVRDNIVIGTYYCGKPFKWEKFKEIIDELQIAHLLEKNIDALSGGEKQRIAIARLLLANKSIILADEPTGALDSKNADKIMNQLKRLSENGKTIIIVTHDKKVAERCDRIIYLENGYAS